MEAAIASLESLKPGEIPNFKKTAVIYGVDQNTLLWCYRGIQGSQTEHYKNIILLNHRQEKELVKYINNLCVQGLPPIRALLHNFALEISGKEVGKYWLDYFLKQYNINLILKYISSIDIVRKRANSAFKYILYFKLLREG